MGSSKQAFVVVILIFISKISRTGIKPDSLWAKMSRFIPISEGDSQMGLKNPSKEIFTV